jgi:hypothetical protein
LLLDVADPGLRPLRSSPAAAHPLTAWMVAPVWKADSCTEPDT